MELQRRSEDKRNHFFPNCDCESQTDCVPCPRCGMCVTNTESCACCALPFGADAGLRYDPHVEILGG